MITYDSNVQMGKIFLFTICGKAQGDATEGDDTMCLMWKGILQYELFSSGKMVDWDLRQQLIEQQRSL